MSESRRLQSRCGWYIPTGRGMGIALRKKLRRADSCRTRVDRVRDWVAAQTPVTLNLNLGDHIRRPAILGIPSSLSRSARMGQAERASPSPVCRGCVGLSHAFSYDNAQRLCSRVRTVMQRPSPRRKPFQAQTTSLWFACVPGLATCSNPTTHGSDQRGLGATTSTMWPAGVNEERKIARADRQARVFNALRGLLPVLLEPVQEIRLASRQVFFSRLSPLTN